MDRSVWPLRRWRVLDGPPNKWTAEDAPALPMEPPTAPSGPVITYPPTNDERLEKLQRSMGKVVFRISSMLDTESIYGEEYGTLTRRSSNHRVAQLDVVLISVKSHFKAARSATLTATD